MKPATFNLIAVLYTHTDTETPIQKHSCKSQLVSFNLYRSLAHSLPLAISICNLINSNESERQLWETGIPDRQLSSAQLSRSRSYLSQSVCLFACSASGNTDWCVPLSPVQTSVCVMTAFECKCNLLISWIWCCCWCRASSLAYLEHSRWHCEDTDKRKAGRQADFSILFAYFSARFLLRVYRDETAAATAASVPRQFRLGDGKERKRHSLTAVFLSFSLLFCPLVIYMSN